MSESATSFTGRYMTRLQQDLDDLDRMVDGNAPKDETKSQIRLISREVVALETDYARHAQDHENLHDAHCRLKKSQAIPSIEAIS
jgi:hypothetical protein